MNYISNLTQQIGLILADTGPPAVGKGIVLADIFTRCHRLKWSSTVFLSEITGLIIIILSHWVAKATRDLTGVFYPVWTKLGVVWPSVFGVNLTDLKREFLNWLIEENSRKLKLICPFFFLDFLFFNSYWICLVCFRSALILPMNCLTSLKK